MDTIYTISEAMDRRYQKMSRKAKVWSLVAVIAIALLLLMSAGMAFYFLYQRNRAIEYGEAELEKSKQNYYIQSISNSNLEKRLQDLILELAKLRNSTIELGMMVALLQEDKVNLEEIRLRLESGVRNAKYQLDKMETSVNSLIKQRSGTLTTTEQELLRRDRDSVYKNAKMNSEQLY